MDRRAVLALFGKSAAASALCWHSNPVRAAFAEVAVSQTPVTQQVVSGTYETQLQADMAKLAKRVYSEEGIPMILACEDLTAKQPVVPASKAMNATMAPALQRYLDTWQRMYPQAPAADVAKLVELLAYRDFARGGKDKEL